MVNATVLNLLHSKRFAVTAASLLSAAAGGATGFVVAKKVLTKRYDALYDHEIAEARAFYNSKSKDEHSPEDLVKELDLDGEKPDVRPEVAMIKEAAHILEEQKYVSYDKPETVVTPQQVLEVQESIKNNIWDTHGEIIEAAVYSPEDDGGFDLDEELEKKGKGLPYILEKEEFFEIDGYSQGQLTWYEGDQVMGDDQSDNEVRDWEKLVGPHNLAFGRGSQDPNIVYICNDQLEIAWEVTRSTEKFSVVVAGLDDSLQHSDGPRVRKFRSNWE